MERSQQIRIRLSFFLIGFLYAIIFPIKSHAEGPSFDCAKAKSPSEKYICEDEILKRQDFAMAKVYQMVLKAGGKRAETVRKEQRDWIKWRDSTCGQGLPESAKMCLREILSRRIAELAHAAGLKPNDKLLTGLPKPSDDIGMYVLLADMDEVYRDTAGVCQAVERNLNYFKREPPMVCEIRISPEQTELSEPDWQAIPPGQEALDLFERLVRQNNRATQEFLRGAGPPLLALTDEYWVKRRPEAAIEIQEGIIRLHRAKFDIDDLSDDEEVIRCYAHNPPCGPLLWKIGSSDPGLHVVDKNDPLGFNHYFDKLGQDQLIPFFFHGRTYFQQWTDVQKIIHYSPYIGKGIRIGAAVRLNKKSKMGNKPTTICDFLYVQFNRGKDK